MAERKYYLPEGLPTPRAQRDGLDKEYWDATRRHELVAQRCNACGAFQWGPEAVCHKCHSIDSGGPGFRDVAACIAGSEPGIRSILRCGRLSLLVAVVELADADDIRMVGNLVGEPTQIRHLMLKSRRCSKIIRTRRWCSGSS